MLEGESFTDDAMLFDDASLNMPSYTALVLNSDSEIN